MDGTVGYGDLTGWITDLLVAPTTPGEIAAKTAIAARVRGWLDVVITDLASAAAGFAAHGQGEGATSVLQRSGRLSAREARLIAKRSELIKAAPVVGVALAAGQIGAGHADVLARCAGKAKATVRALLLEHAADLVESAKAMSPEKFEEHCERELRELEDDDGADRLERQRQQSFLKNWKDTETGMFCGRFALDPERGSRLFNAIEAELQQLWSEQPHSKEESTETVLDNLAAQALINLIGHGHATLRPSADVHLHIDHDTMRTGLLSEFGLCELSDGTQIPVGTARRLCCQANIIPIVLGTDGEVLDVGREERYATRAQRRALGAMYRTCGFTDCNTPFDRCEIHHVLPYEQWGPTDLANLVPLCWIHHHLVHEGGWTLTLDPRRTITITRADGYHHATIEHATIARSTTRNRQQRGRPRPPNRNGPPPPGPAPGPGPGPGPGSVPGPAPGPAPGTDEPGGQKPLFTVSA